MAGATSAAAVPQSAGQPQPAGVLELALERGVRSRSLREFWSSRWNAAFVEMNQVIIMPALRPRLGRSAASAAFVISGLMHEVAISLPVGQGFGIPTLYFTLHGAATVSEQRIGVHRWPAWLARLWTWALVLVPLPLLFHSAFRDALVLPLFGVKR
jgi:alginate O-acetyltransferase complex protein AlgI